MYPDLSYIFHALIGTSPDNGLSVVKTFGFFMALAFLVAAWILGLELKRKTAMGLIVPDKVRETVGLPASPAELAFSALFGFLLGFKLVYIAAHFPEFKQDAAAVLFSSKGNVLAGLLGAALFGFLKYREKDKQRLDKPQIKETLVQPQERVGDMAVIAAVWGLIGAKIFHLLEYWQDFLADPVGQFFSGSGLTMYGGLLGGFIGVYRYSQKHGIRPIHVMDAVAPALIVAYGVGRLGCHFSGDGDWGINNLMQTPSWWFLPDSWWSSTYPHNVLNDGIPITGCTWKHCSQLQEPVFPTPLYEAVASFLIGGFLWAVRKRIQVPGVLFFMYLFLNGMERYWVEKIRINPDYHFLGIAATQAEIIAILLMIGGVAGILVCRKKFEVQPNP